MSHLHDLSTEEIAAELQRRKGDTIGALKADAAKHRAEIARIDAEIAALTGEKPAKATRTRAVKVDPVEADAKILAAFKSVGLPINTSILGHATGFDKATLKSALARLEAAGKIQRTGKARATVYGVA